jgi:cytochrome c oxidase subunit 4
MNTAATASHASTDDHDTGAIHVHALPLKVLFGVYAILVVLTILTVAVAYMELGKLNIWVAMLIAVLKASFVVLYFMHLRYDNLFNGLVLVVALLFVALFIAVTMMDTAEYKGNMNPPGTRIMMTSQNGG